MNKFTEFLSELTAMGMFFAAIFVILTIVNLGWPLIPFAIWWFFFQPHTNQQ